MRKKRSVNAPSTRRLEDKANIPNRFRRCTSKPLHARGYEDDNLGGRPVKMRRSKFVSN